VPWPHCPNKNVLSNRLNWPYDSPLSLRLGGKLFQTSGPVVAKVLSPKLLHVRLTASVMNVARIKFKSMPEVSVLVYSNSSSGSVFR